MLGYLDGVPILVNIRLRGWSCTKVSEHLNVIGFHQSLGFWVGQQLLKQSHGVDMVVTAFEPVAVDIARDFEVRINPFIGYALEGF